MPASYDEVPYDSYPFPQSHPDRIALVAALMGLPSAPVAACRVLEVGCAAGGNILPMADGLPDSTFVGIDLSSRQIEEARAEAAALGLANVELRCADIADAGSVTGEFDYIVCHGVFSWVSQPTQEALLALCGRHLTPEGIAYVSYNTLPGWRMRGAVRDIMQFHSARFTDPRQQVEQSVSLLDFLARAGGEGAPFTAFLRSEADSLRRAHGSHILHDHLEEHNDPVYFHEFLSRAAAHGLAYVGEADVQAMMPPEGPPEIRRTLDMLSQGGQAHLEQYLDFVRCRMFRQTALCRAGRQADYTGTADRLAGLHIASPARPASPRPDLPPAEEAFDGPAGVRITSREPLIKAALTILAESWPASLPFAELCRRARERAGPAAADPEGDGRRLAETLWRFYATAGVQALDLSTRPYAGPARPSARPSVRPLARRQAARGQRHVTNLRHDAVYLNDFERQALPLFDGTRDAPGLAEALAALVASGTLTVQQEGRPVSEPATVRAVLSVAVARLIAQFTRQSLLVG